MTRALTDAFQLLRRLGHGAMAEVHLAEERGTGRRFAVKRMLPHMVDDPEMRARFDEEIAVLQQLDHPNIISLVEVAEDEGQPVMVLQHLPGPSLLGLHKASKGLARPVAVRVIGELLSALGYAHGVRDAGGEALGLVHRDVTPSNLLFGQGARPVLIDFGVARTRGRAPLTKTGAVIGKVGYLAPEIARGEDVDERADLFSVGALLFELVCGAPAFSGSTLGDVLNRVASGGHEDPRALRPELTDAQVDLLLKGIACAPEARFKTAWEMSAGLHEAFESAGADDVVAAVEALFPGTTGAQRAPSAPEPGSRNTVTIATRGMETQSMLGTEPSSPPVDDEI
jgi:serine/threonine-protein kinase